MYLAWHAQNKNKKRNKRTVLRGFEPEANGRAEIEKLNTLLASKFLASLNCIWTRHVYKERKKKELTGLEPRAHVSGSNRADTYPLSYRNIFVNSHPETHESANA